MLQWRYISDEYKAQIDQFQCNDEVSVQSFLIEEALHYHELNLARTRLYFDKNQNLAGYFTVYNDMMTIGREKRRKHGLQQLPSYKFYPALKLHYLGIDQRYRKKKYGEYLLLEVLCLSQEVSEKTGCLFLSLESLPSAIGFYKKYEFEHLNRRDIYYNMFFKIAEL